MNVMRQSSFLKVIWHTFGLADFSSGEWDKTSCLKAPVPFFLLLENRNVATDRNPPLKEMGDPIVTFFFCKIRKFHAVRRRTFSFYRIGNVEILL